MVAVRPARADEVIDVRHAVLRAGQQRETAIFPGDDAPDTRHWVATDDAGICGVVTVVRSPWPDAPDGPVWQLRGMGTLARVRGSGVGAQLLAAVHAAIPEPLWCNARANVVGFYARYGWHPVGPVFDIPPIGPHQRMRRG